MILVSTKADKSFFSTGSYKSSTGFSFSRNTESQQSSEPNKSKEERLSSDGKLRRQMTRCSRIHCVPLCMDNCMRQHTTKRDLSESLSVRSSHTTDLLRYLRDYRLKAEFTLVRVADTPGHRKTNTTSNRDPGGFRLIVTITSLYPLRVATPTGESRVIRHGQRAPAYDT